MPSHSLYCDDEIVGDSIQIGLIKQCIDRVALSDAAVLITGETGTGKELFARRVHHMSSRRDRPFVPINCAAIPDSLLESELFGFEKGAFTGASLRQGGMLAEGDGGTVFLDEIGDLSLSAQAKLLRVLEQKEVRPVGSRKTQTIDFRLVAATNRDLGQLAAQGGFRQDLLFRVNVIHVRIPPLRERQEDILLIADHFLKMFTVQSPRAFVGLTPGARRRLMQIPWVGNVRELRNVIERAFLLSESECITEQNIAQMYDLAGSQSTQVPIYFQVAPKGQPHTVSRTSYRYSKVNSSETSEQEHIRKTLEETHWNKSEAAKLLRCSRMTLYRKVVQYQLHSPSAPPFKLSLER